MDYLGKKLCRRKKMAGFIDKKHARGINWRVSWEIMMQEE